MFIFKLGVESDVKKKKIETFHCVSDTLEVHENTETGNEKGEYKVHKSIRTSQCQEFYILHFIQTKSPSFIRHVLISDLLKCESNP